MQTLCPSEIQAIKDDITEKELVSAEILSGVYDHFLSHLENQGVEKSQNELGELDHVYSKQYCHALQPKLRKRDCKKIMQTHLECTSFLFLFFLMGLFGGTPTYCILPNVKFAPGNRNKNHHAHSISIDGCLSFLVFLSKLSSKKAHLK